MQRDRRSSQNNPLKRIPVGGLRVLSAPIRYTPIGCQVVLVSVNASMKSRPCAVSEE